jgi:hypothetical protein
MKNRYVVSIKSFVNVVSVSKMSVQLNEGRQMKN